MLSTNSVILCAGIRSICWQNVLLSCQCCDVECLSCTHLQIKRMKCWWIESMSCHFCHTLHFNQFITGLQVYNTWLHCICNIINIYTLNPAGSIEGRNIQHIVFTWNWYVEAARDSWCNLFKIAHRFNVYF